MAQKGSAEAQSGVSGPPGMQPLGTMTIPGKPGRAQEASSTNAGGPTLGAPKGMVPLGTVRVPTPPNRIGPPQGASESDGDNDSDMPRGAGNPVKTTR